MYVRERETQGHLLYTPVNIHMYLDYSQVYKLKKGLNIHLFFIVMLINRQRDKQQILFVILGE